jgi:hypothetical protein
MSVMLIGTKLLNQRSISSSFSSPIDSFVQFDEFKVQKNQALSDFDDFDIDYDDYERENESNKVHESVTNASTDPTNYNQNQNQLKRANLSTLSTFENFLTLQQLSPRIVLTTIPAVSNHVSIQLPSYSQPGSGLGIRLTVIQDSTVFHSFQYSIGDPNLCPLNLQCLDSVNGECDKYSGECTCPSGAHRMPLDAFQSKCQLTCENQCQNGSCLSNAPNDAAKCACDSGWGGDRCEIQFSCNEQKSINSQFCASRGYIKSLWNHSTSEYECSAECHCEGFWSTLPNTDVDKQCQECSLNNICHKTGTDLGKTKVDCVQCICKAGYSGEHCQTRSLMGTIAFQKSELFARNMVQDSISQFNADLSFNILVDSDKATNTIRPLDLSDSTLLQLQQDLSLSLNVPQSNLKLARSIQNITSVPVSKAQMNQTTQTIVTFTISSTQSAQTDPDTPSIAGNAELISMGDLYNHWKNLKENSGYLPIGANTEITQEYGFLMTHRSAYDPVCTQTDDILECPDGEDPFVDKQFVEDVEDPPAQRTTSSKTIIIIAVVVPVVVLALVVAIAILIKYAHVKKKWCFDEPGNKHNESIDEPENEHNKSTTMELSQISTSKPSADLSKESIRTSFQANNLLTQQRLSLLAKQHP